MMKNRLKNNIGIFFVVFSLIMGVSFYLLFGLRLEFKHPFLKTLFLELFLGCHLVLTIITYWLSFRNDIKDTHKNNFSRTREYIIAFIVVPIISMIFPAIALIGLYPISMAVFHLIILFYTGLSFSAIILTAYISIRIWQSGSSISVQGINAFLISSGVIVPLAISYSTLILFSKLPLG